MLVLTDANSGDMKHKLAPTVRVTIDGKPKTLSDLQKGMRARATTVRIEALDKNKDLTIRAIRLWHNRMYEKNVAHR